MAWPLCFNAAFRSPMWLNTMACIAPLSGVESRQSRQKHSGGRKKLWDDWRPPGPIPREPDVIPLFPVTSFTPQSTCPHHRAIPAGSSFVCMVCNNGSRRTEEHPALAITPVDLLALEVWEDEHDNGPTSYQPDPVLKGGIG